MPLYLVIFALTLISIDVDIDLLVLACRASSIGEDLPRGGRIEGLHGLALGRDCARWCIFLSKGIGPNT